MPVSYQAQSPVLGLVLPSNSPGVHTLWLPIIPMQIGLVLKPGPQEPWTPYRMAAAFFQAGHPARSDLDLSRRGRRRRRGAASTASAALIFGGTATVERYRGNAKVQAHGPGFSKILLGDDVVDNWEKYLDLMVDSVYVNSGRGCINCSGIWASRHTREIAEALAERLAADRVRCRRRIPNASLAAFTVPGAGRRDLGHRSTRACRQPGVTDVTAKYRDGPRVVEGRSADYLRPTVMHCDSPDAAIAKKEYMFPFVDGGRVPAGRRCSRRSARRSCARRSPSKPELQRQLIDAMHIDRLNLGPMPTIKLNWLQPHEGNIVEFLFRARAFQTA